MSAHRREDFKLPVTVLILSYHFYPSQEIGARRVTALAAYLVQHGCRVVVISAFGEQEIEDGSEVLPGVVALQVRQPPATFLRGAVALKRMLRRRPESSLVGSSPASRTVPVRVSLVARIRDAYFRGIYFIDGYKRWAWRANLAANRAAVDYPVSVIVASGPPHSALIAGACSARLRRVPFVADLRDPWADDVDGTSRRKGFERDLLTRIERAVLESASAITSTGATVADLLGNRNEALREKIHVIRNGFDGSSFQRGTSTLGRLSMLFAGELYVGRDPFPFLRAVEWLLHQPGVDSSRVRVTFMGKADTYDGKRLSEFLAGTVSESVVHMLPPQTPDAVDRAVEESTVLLNLAQGQRLSVPAKTFEHLASGRENLLLCENDCETARLVAGVAGVNQVDPADFERLTATLLDLYKRHVRGGEMRSPNGAEIERFSRRASNRAFLDLLLRLASREVVSGVEGGQA